MTLVAWLGFLLAASGVAFFAVKLIGAAYLIWLGIDKWRTPPQPLVARQAPVRSKGLLVQGVLVNLTNPKAIIFIGALVPQFIDPAQLQVRQYLLIAGTLCVTDVIAMSAYALAARQLGCWFSDPGALRLQNRLFGGLFVAAGALLAFSSRS